MESKKLKYAFAAIVIIILLLNSAVSLKYLFYDNNEKQIVYINKDSTLSLLNKSPEIPDELYFAGERVPIEIPSVKERLERELLVNQYWHSQTILWIKRSARWLPEISSTLLEKNIPDELKYISVIESNLTNVVSPAGAAGFWQIMPVVAKASGLIVRNDVDERYHLRKSTLVAADYLREAKQKFGNWTLAAASYNRGVPGLSRAIESQGQNNFYNLYLNEETSRYIFRILAAKLVLENPEKYGFYIPDKEKYSSVDIREIEVKKTIGDLASFANDAGYNYRILKTFNPWLRDTVLKNNEGRSFIFQMPADPEKFIVNP
ncbi:MAG: lytic transglycosylase domain-containing protein [Ignavibacteriales bacterium]|nr:lytic transglycosylase domain-containing protein [Ignavibacteriales bacterium]MCF8316560.1 lytic transglycosylase domain-containing protein [Ignavibacteriales bacterium]MCF8437483.1 lytic transglycosylase domain-containing protein [Ignavibacteriales bacterium]